MIAARGRPLGAQCIAARSAGGKKITSSSNLTLNENLNTQPSDHSGQSDLFKALKADAKAAFNPHENLRRTRGEITAIDHSVSPAPSNVCWLDHFAVFEPSTIH
ncbi:MAG TPA: hypothetical protein K8W01_17840 [Methylorubrum populi]|uniref:Uncharacterized protein n=1 Tax=Methylorubrum populi TaxID=223967 RepID=A0A921E5Z1_9HYPH|nr:hypothetical protein [Methylorubrum populi]